MRCVALRLRRPSCRHLLVRTTRAPSRLAQASTMGYKYLGGLVTHEDPFHIHKMLGVASLVHFVYRFSQIGPSDMGFGDGPETAALLGMHALLSVSSLVFHIPRKRIREGSRIWPEYRLHSIIFAIRSIVYCLLVWQERRTGAEPNFTTNYALVFATICAADIASWYHRDVKSGTIRDMQAPGWVRFFFSLMQIHATTAILIGVRRVTAQFCIVGIVQLTAFMMTVRRKNLIAHQTWITLYGCLLIAGCVGMVDNHKYASYKGMGGAIGNAAVILRVGFGFPKYVLWGLATAAIAIGRDATQLYDIWPVLNVATWLLLIPVGYWKVYVRSGYSGRGDDKQKLKNG